MENNFIPKEIYEYKNINIKLLPRLNSEDFLKTLFLIVKLLFQFLQVTQVLEVFMNQ